MNWKRYFLAIGVAALLMLPTLQGGVRRPGVLTPIVILSVLFLGTVCSGLAFLLWAAAVRDLGSTTTGAYLYLEPFVTWVTAWYWLDERINAIGLAGGITVLIGVWCVSVGKQRTKKQL